MKTKNNKIDVRCSRKRSCLNTVNNEDYISITDIAKYQDEKRTDYIIKNLLRSRNIIEFLGIWENSITQILNPSNSRGLKIKQVLTALFGMTAKTWRENNPDKTGNIRDYANVSQLVCLSNLESLNAVLINDGLEQSQRLEKLNKIAISQLKILIDDGDEYLAIGTKDDK